MSDMYVNVLNWIRTINPHIQAKYLMWDNVFVVIYKKSQNFHSISAHD